jgi:hypothetical protein
MTERTVTEVTRETLKCADFCIRVAALGAVNSPQEGAGYLPTTLEEVDVFEAHQWVKNAVLMAFTMGAWKGSASPADFATTAHDARSAGMAVAHGADMYKFMSAMLEVSE